MTQKISTATNINSNNNTNRAISHHYQKQEQQQQWKWQQQINCKSCFWEAIINRNNKIDSAKSSYNNNNINGNNNTKNQRSNNNNNIKAKYVFEKQLSTGITTLTVPKAKGNTTTTISMATIAPKTRGATKQQRQQQLKSKSCFWEAIINSSNSTDRAISKSS